MRPPKKISQKEIARRLGISHVSVSNALAGRKGVSRELRERVLQTAARMEYEIKQERCPGNAEWKEIAVIGTRQIPEKLSHRDRVHFRYFPPEALTGGICEPLLREWQSCIGFLATERVPAGVLRQLLETVKKPIVGMGFFVGGVSMDFVMEDGFHGIQILARALRERGYERLVYVNSAEAEASLEERSMLEDRLLGFRRDQYTQLLENAEEVETVPAFDLGERDGIVPLQQLPKWLVVRSEGAHARQQRTALICGDEQSARGAVEILRAAGIAVPAEIGVVGYGTGQESRADWESGADQVGREGQESQADRKKRRVAMFRTDEEQLAECAVRILKDRWENGTDPEGLHYVSGVLVNEDTI